ncbi:MAG: ammonium transporter [Rhizonema sp. PD37]|nr:ammonium transporter [Rhizonema sp. PD37]
MYKKKRKKLKEQKNWLSINWKVCLPLAAIMLLISVGVAIATDSQSEIETKLTKATQAIDTIWVLLTACLVFFMNAGFAMVETGFCRRKNAVSVLIQTFIVFALATVAFWVTGFGLMFFGRGDNVDQIIGLFGFFLEGNQKEFHSPSLNVPWEAIFFFELVFADTATTIFTGVVAERIKFWAFFWFSLFFVGFIYPVPGHWIWGQGWLYKLNFWDFAGSTVVHSVGGWAGLVGAWLLGPRIARYKLQITDLPTDSSGKFAQNNLPRTRVLGLLCSRRTYIRREDVAMGNAIKTPIDRNAEIKKRPLPSHNLGIATLGSFILWLGWFGFNPGSTLKADPNAIAHIFLTTNMAASTGGIAATITTRFHPSFRKPYVPMILNGVLTGLVSITASCAFVSIPYAAVIGAIAGVLVVFSTLWIEDQKIDDPVGAISVHLVGGIWGTLALGLFSSNNYNVWLRDWLAGRRGPEPGLISGLLELHRFHFTQLGIQLLGVVAVGIFTLTFSYIAWFAIDKVVGLRVNLQVERDGLDESEHLSKAYDGFQPDPELLDELIASPGSTHLNNH